MNMRTAALLFCLAVAGSLGAQEEPKPAPPQQPPDFSRESLQRVFSANGSELPPRPDANVKYGFGYVEFRALGMDWRITYLPIMMPLSGTALRTNREPVDPFALTGTSIATTPRTFVTRRELNRERKRIKKTERARLKATNQ